MVGAKLAFGQFPDLDHSSVMSGRNNKMAGFEIIR
jgi:hypothetical protein